MWRDVANAGMRMRLLGALGLALAASPSWAQEVFRCTAADGKVTYQQSPCPKTDEARKVDTTPANSDYDPAQRERLLKAGDEAGKRLEARAAAEEADRKRREEQRERDEQREREARAREEAREPQYIYAGPPGWRPPYPPPGPRPQPRPVPLPSGR
ncbi:hypothetical protein DSM104443_04163 [Usitatibacter rugosus]|uniref:DUF4124 domain-containing protein n=2 Tax=Usitatibacter rugosus TaxID=2732067 RepID=A0A6M4H0P0_9PROT|nr:hypothetical protein DSM104443_04163 [Usitatibacter rugosus]